MAYTTLLEELHHVNCQQPSTIGHGLDWSNTKTPVTEDDINEAMGTIVKLVDYKTSNILAALLQDNRVALFHYKKPTLPNLEIFSPDHQYYDANIDFLQDLENRVDDPTLVQEKQAMCESMSIYYRKMNSEISNDNR